MSYVVSKDIGQGRDLPRRDPATTVAFLAGWWILPCAALGAIFWLWLLSALFGLIF
ncbi:hypothetical protein [Thioclava sp. SK-1]|uniref:hypothetical protein n=1 Tax=Thioclava sp. SK-1 TaxID=1889770 RepID=UPI00159EFE84|nr:hypothetical protein [Thioclava sp. SK-1]